MALGDEGRKAALIDEELPHIPDPGKARTVVIARTGPDFDNEGSDGVSEKHEFDLDYLDERRNYRWTGHFKCHIMSGLEEVQFGRLMAQYRGNVPPDSLDLMTLQITEMYAKVIIAVDAAPPWMKGNRLLEIKDIGVVAAIYKEVRDHEARFWGADTESEDAGDGSGSGDDA